MRIGWRVGVNARLSVAYVLFACVLVACLGGCTQTQIETTRIKTTTTETVAATDRCAATVAGKPEYRDLKARTLFSKSESIPPELLSDGRRPSRDEIRALYRVHGEMQECRRLAVTGATNTHPLILSAMAEAFATADQALLAFARAAEYKTWGDYNQALVEIYLQAQARVMQAFIEIDHSLQGDASQRAQAAASFQDWSRQQRALYAQQPSGQPRAAVIIDCSYAGDVLQCRTGDLRGRPPAGRS
jgi:hypothetical protein